MENIMTVLEALATPAFFWKDGTVLRCNSSCSKIPLRPGDGVDLPAQLQADGTNQARLTLGGGIWNATAKQLDGELFVSLIPEQTVESVGLLSAVTRSLRDPLTSFLAGCGILFPQLEEAEDEDVQEKAGAITRCFFRLFRVNTMVRDTCRLTADQKMYVEKTDIKEFFDEQAMIWQDALADAEIELQYQGPQKAFKGNIDRYLVSCAVLHLLSNAAIYHEEGTPLKLSVSYMHGRVKVRVENRGKPIPPEVFSTVFSRYNEMPEMGDSRWGSGFGLHLVQTVAQKHGGAVMLQSEDGGTTATMVMDLDTPVTDVDTPFVDMTGGYDPSLVILSDVLPAKTYDSRNIEF